MKGKDKELDIKIMQAFTDAYYELYQNNKINRKQLEQVLDLINELEVLPVNFLLRQLEEIFPEWDKENG